MEKKFKNRMKDLLNIHKNQINELHSAAKTTVIKSDKFAKTNNLSNNFNNFSEGKKFSALNGTNLMTKVSTTSNTEQTSKNLK